LVDFDAPSWQQFNSEYHHNCLPSASERNKPFSVDKILAAIKEAAFYGLAESENRIKLR